MTFERFIKKYNGKRIDYDGVYGVQCVDLIKLYIEKVIGVKPQSIGNAIEYYNKRYSEYLYSMFKPITPSSRISAGDIVVFRTSGVGHVAIANGVRDTEGFYCYDENYNYKGSGMQLNYHRFKDKKYVPIIYLRPRKNIFKTHTETVVSMKTEAYCYKPDLKTIYKVKEILEINPTIDRVLKTLTKSNKARYKLNTKITIKQLTLTNKGDLFARTPTCWIKIYSNSKDKYYI